MTLRVVAVTQLPVGVVSVTVTTAANVAPGAGLFQRMFAEFVFVADVYVPNDGLLRVQAYELPGTLGVENELVVLPQAIDGPVIAGVGVASTFTFCVDVAKQAVFAVVDSTTVSVPVPATFHVTVTAFVPWPLLMFAPVTVQL